MWRVMIQSFVVIPFFIALAATLFHAALLALTSEPADAHTLLDAIQHGNATQRWQSAYKLAELLNTDSDLAHTPVFQDGMLDTFEATASERDPRARQYMAMALGRAGDAVYADALVAALGTDPEPNAAYILHALGALREPNTRAAVTPYASHENTATRLQAIIALGAIGAPESADILANALNDSEPNIQWDAAIGLARMGDPRGNGKIEDLMRRDYLRQFDAVDASEQQHILLTSIAASKTVMTGTLESALRKLAESDPDASVRMSALDALQGISDADKQT